MEMLMNFERDLQKLRAVRLHPALQFEGRQCLLDLLKENDMRRLADGCFSSQKQFEMKVSQLKANFLELKKRVENLFNVMSSSGCKDLEKLIKEHQGVISEQKSIMQSLRLGSAFVGTIYFCRERFGVNRLNDLTIPFREKNGKWFKLDED